jgi:hypothetical protein
VIELRWKETSYPGFSVGAQGPYPVDRVTRVLQYRVWNVRPSDEDWHGTPILAEYVGENGPDWSDWRDVPTVSDPE